MTTGKLYLEAKLMNNYEEELKYKETLIEKEIFESQDQLDFTQKFLQACVIPFPDLDQDKRLFKTYIRISEGLGSKLEVKRNQMNENNVLQKEGKVRRTPFQLWTDLFHSHPILKVALFFFTVHLILVLFTSLLRVLFYDQFLSMMIIGQMFIFVHFNILWAFKLAAGNSSN